MLKALILAVTLYAPVSCTTQPAKDFCQFVFNEPTCPSHG